MPEPLVLLPEMMCDARLFGPQIAELSSEFAVMVAPVTGGERIEEIASGLLDQLPRRFALAGLGFGGMVAMELLRRAPDRVSRLMLISTTPLAETPQVAAAREPRIIKARTGSFEEVIAQEFPSSRLAPGAFRREVQELAMDMGRILGPEVFVRQSRALQRRRDQQSTMRICKVPTMVLCGEHDQVLPVKRHSFLSELIPNAALRVLPDTGHLPCLEDPAGTTLAIRDWMDMLLVLS